MDKGWITSRHEFDYFQFGPHVLLLQWPKSKSFATMERILNWRDHILSFEYTAIEDITLGYHSLTLFFNSRRLSQQSLIKAIELSSLKDQQQPRERAVHIVKVDYSLQNGEDLPGVAEYTGLKIENIIELHTSPIYKIHFIGFLPGFLYLGGLDERLTLPRRNQPRISVPAGSVAIAAGQTGIYPIASPGGWHIIGRTDTQLFDPSHDPPCPYQPGDELKFEAI